MRPARGRCALAQRRHVGLGARALRVAARPIDAVAPRELEQLAVERPEAQAVIEVAQVRELVAQRVHEARVLERAAGERVAQADADRAVREADAVAAASRWRARPRSPCTGARSAARCAARRVEAAPSAVRQPFVHAARRSFRARPLSSRSRTRVVDLDTMPAASSALALFPLANVVLFPRVQTPLHVFEPRYRQLTRACARRRSAHRHGRRAAGAPGAHARGSAALPDRLRRDDQRAPAAPDGRFDIVLHGTLALPHRATRSARAADRLYRVARDREARGCVRGRGARARDRAAPARDRDRRRSSAAPHGSPTPRFDPAPFASIDDVTFVNALSNAIALRRRPRSRACSRPTSIPERYERLSRLLGVPTRELDAPGSARPPHDASRTRSASGLSRTSC